MSENGNHQAIELITARPLSSAAAKAHFLAWADESDARRLKARSSMGAIASVGAATILGGIVIARVLLPRRSKSSAASVGSVGVKLVSWALVARAGKWLLPHAIRAVQSSVKQRALSR